MTKEQKTKMLKEKFIGAYKKMNCNISETCDFANIGRQTYYVWIENDAEFKQEIEDIKESLIDKAENALQNLIEQGNATGILFFLKTVGKNRGYVEAPGYTVAPVQGFTIATPTVETPATPANIANTTNTDKSNIVNLAALAAIAELSKVSDISKDETPKNNGNE